MSELKKLKAKAASRNIGTDAPGGGYERHVLFCVGGDCGKTEAKDSLKHLRKRIKALEKEIGRHIYCTPVECLQVCKGGPLAVVYPEGAWYHGLTPEACDRVFDEHLIGGAPVEDLLFARNPLVPSGDAMTDETP